MHRITAIARAAAAAALVAATPALGAVPHVLTYSGYLKTSGGVPVTTSTNLTFRLYTLDAGGSPIWSETLAVVPTSDGWFSAVLGTVTALPAGAVGTQDLYLGVQVASETELAPRARLTSGPSALAVDWSAVQGKPGTCAAGDFLTVDGSGTFKCATPAGGGGTVTSVSAAAGTPITVLNGTTTPQIGIARADATHDGYLSMGDWSTFSAKLTPPAGCATGQVIGWTATGWACTTPSGGGGVTAVTASAPLASSGGTTPNLTLSAASGTSSGYVTAADYLAFSGKAPAPAAACLLGQVLTWTGTAFSCVADLNSGGTVTGVTAAAPVVSSGGAAPQISMARASGSADGYLAAADWTAFTAKISTPAPACATGQTLSWSGSAWACGNAVSSVTAGSGLILSGTALAPVVSLVGCGGVSGQILQWNGSTWSCIPTPSGGGGGVTSVSPDPVGGVAVSPTTGSVVVGLTKTCSAGQILKWNGTAWSCAADDNSGGTVTGVGKAATAGNPIVVGGTAAAPTIDLPAASGAGGGYLSSADYARLAPAGCAASQIPKWSGAAWACAADANSGGTVTSVSGSGPISVATGSTTPVISIGAASGTTSGYLTAADFQTFAGKAPSPGVAACLPGQVLTWTGAAFSCVADANSGGTVTSVSGSGPISVATGTTTPVVGISQASGITSGFLAAADFLTFAGKAPSPGPACPTGQVLTWTGTAFTCVADANTTYTAGAGLALAGTQFAASLLSGGRNGSATTLARSDHSHAAVTTIPLSDFAVTFGTATLAPTTLVSGIVVLPAWTYTTGNACIMAAVRIPPGTGGSTGTPPIIRVAASAAATVASNIQFANSGLVAGAALPNSQWGAPGAVGAVFTAGQLVEVTNAGASLGSFQVVGSSPPVYAGAGDLFTVRLCGGTTGIQVFSVMLTWN